MDNKNLIVEIVSMDNNQEKHFNLKFDCKIYIKRVYDYYLSFHENEIGEKILIGTYYVLDIESLLNDSISFSRKGLLENETKYDLRKLNNSLETVQHKVWYELPQDGTENKVGLGVYYKDGSEIFLGDNILLEDRWCIGKLIKQTLFLDKIKYTPDDYNYTDMVIVNSSEEWKYYTEDKTYVTNIMKDVNGT